MDPQTKAVVDRILLGCDIGNMARDEFRNWRLDNASSPLTECFDWILQGQLEKYTDTLCVDDQIEKDIADPNGVFFADQMDMYTLDTTIIATALTQLTDEGIVDAEARPYVSIALRRQCNPRVGRYDPDSLGLVQRAMGVA